MFRAAWRQAVGDGQHTHGTEQRNAPIDEVLLTQWPTMAG
jgi:hypothetical protein